MSNPESIASLVMASPAAAAGVDLSAFDAVSESEQGCPVEMKGTDGMTPTGVTFIVLGKNADVVTKWTAKIVDTNTREQQMAQRKGKLVEPKSLEQVYEQNREGAAIRVTGWIGVKQPFDGALLRNALRRNPHWVEQVVAASEDAGNFPQKPQAS